MAVAPALDPPEPGAYICRHDELGDVLAYVKRQSAVRQATAWNDVLRDDPVFGPSSGYVVGVGAKVGQRWPLVWVRLPQEIDDQSSQG